MNDLPTQFSVIQTGSFSVVDASKAAERAIRDNDIATLRQMIENREIRSDTRVRDGATLLMVAVQHRRLDAFNALIAQGFDAPRELRLSNPHLGNLVHCMVRYMDDHIFAEPSSDPAWRDRLRSFFDEHGHHIDWDQTNWEQFGPHDLAHHLDHVRFAAFLARYMPESEASQDAIEEHLTSTVEASFSLIPPHRVAMQAIADDDMVTLQRMIDHGEIRSRTRTADGITLLMVAIQHRHLGAFNALRRAGFQAEDELGLMNAHEGTLIHGMVRYLDDAIMGTPSSHSAWRDSIHAFFNLHHQHIRWREENWDDQNPLVMAEGNHHDNWADFLRRREHVLLWHDRVPKHDFLGRKRLG